MIVNVRHTGIVVLNINESRIFYEVLGFVVFSSNKESGDFIDKVTGINNVELEWIKMKSVDGFVLELLQYHSHPHMQYGGNLQPNRFGYSHIAITVKNALESCEMIKSLGGSVINPPAVSNCGKAKLAYCYDSQGIMLEVVEEL